MKRLILSLLLLTQLISCSSTNTYDIRPATNGNYNAIINIKRSATTSCSAFVISDKIAVTAGHCIPISASWMKESMPKVMEDIPKEIEELKREIESLKADCYKDTCDKQIGELGALIRIKNKYLEFLQKTETPSMYRVFDIYGNDTKISAMALESNSERDFGLIIGDFRKFNKLPVRIDFTVKPGEMLRSCGFPDGTSPAICIDFRAVGQYGFYYAGESMLVPGMSGGPVINSNGEVVGINSRVMGELSIMAPTLGLFSVQ